MSFDKILKNAWRYPLQAAMRCGYRGGSVRIVSSNCIGGFLYHDLGLQFLSPTINLSIGGFVPFCESLQELMQKEPHQVDNPEGSYPMAMIDNVLLRAIHYQNYEDFHAKWTRRAKRFREETDAPIFLIASDAQVGQDEIERFHRLPYPKVCFTLRKEIPYSEFVYVPGFEGCDKVGDLTRFSGVLGKRKFEQYFDCVGWLNTQGKL